MYRFCRVEIILVVPHITGLQISAGSPIVRHGSCFHSGEKSELAGQPAIIKLLYLMPHQPVSKSYSGTEIKAMHNVKNKFHIHKHFFTLNNLMKWKQKKKKTFQLQFSACGNLLLISYFQPYVPIPSLGC